MRWAAVDFETATSSRSSACALGVVIVEDGRELHRQAWLIRPPGNRYDVGNVAIHGIRPVDTEDAPDFSRVWSEAMAMIEDRPLVAHNAPFDVGVIRAGRAGTSRARRVIERMGDRSHAAVTAGWHPAQAADPEAEWKAANKVAQKNRENVRIDRHVELQSHERDERCRRQRDQLL